MLLVVAQVKGLAALTCLQGLGPGGSLSVSLLSWRLSRWQVAGPYIVLTLCIVWSALRSALYCFIWGNMLFDIYLSINTWCYLKYHDLLIWTIVYMWWARINQLVKQSSCITWYVWRVIQFLEQFLKQTCCFTPLRYLNLNKRMKYHKKVRSSHGVFGFLVMSCTSTW